LAAFPTLTAGQTVKMHVPFSRIAGKERELLLAAQQQQLILQHQQQYAELLRHWAACQQK